MKPQNGTDKLLIALYGKSDSTTIGKAIGGHDAQMLHDAAKEIERLRTVPVLKELEASTPVLCKLAKLAKEDHQLAKELLDAFGAYRVFVNRNLNEG